MKTNESNKKSLVLIGLPHSGKSTFIGALWHVVESGELDGSLTITSLPKDREYLNYLRMSWFRCESPERNKVEVAKEILLDVTYGEDNEPTALYFPDVSGEMYKLQFENRQLTSEYVESLEYAKGMILFINPDYLKKPDLISDANKLISDEGAINENSVVEIDGKSSSEENEEIASGDEVKGNESDDKNIDQKSEDASKQWKHEDAPTQVIITDLLQMISMHLKHPIKIALVISAWDVIMDSHDDKYRKLKPREWISKELPLLAQYLVSNDDSFISEVYGISAQGSDYDADLSKLFDMDKQSDRIRVQVGEAMSNDICKPIVWLLK